MADLKEKTLQKLMSASPGLPRENPTAAVWQEPPHPTVANAHSKILPDFSDIVIIGSGITGCAVAHTLLHSKSTLRVTVLEARQAVSGATGRNGGHLLSDSLSLVSKLVHVIGTDASLEMVRFSEANIARIKELIPGLDTKEQELIGLRDVIATAAFGDVQSLTEAKEDIGLLEQVSPGSAAHHSVISAEAACSKYKYNSNIVGALEQHGAAALSPYRLITAVFRLLLEQFSGRFTLETHTAVQSIRSDSISNADFPYTVHTSRGDLRAGKVIHCTNGFASQLLPNLAGRIFPMRGTMSMQQPSPSFLHVGNSISWSYFHRPELDATTGEFVTGLYYAQQNPITGAIFIGGERQPLTEMLSGDDSTVATEARENLQNILPQIYDAAIVEPVGEQKVWSGILGFTSDGLPLVGRMDVDVTERDGDGEWIAAGFNGHGMDKCWLAGEAVAKMVLGLRADMLPSVFLASPERLARMGSEQAARTFLGAGIEVQ